MARVVFMGTPEFAVPALEAVAKSKAHSITGIYTQPDKPAGRGLGLKPSAVKAKAAELGIPVFQPEKLSAPGEFERLEGLRPEVIVVVAYGQILKRNVLELPRLGCVNIHSSLLPRWRGAAPIHWAMLSGDAETGVTTMKLVERLDAGDILLQEKTPITEQDTVGALHDRLARMGAELILPTLSGLEDGTLKGICQDESQVTYATKLTKEMEWLDPARPAEELGRQVRALNPWPGASVWVGGDFRQKLKIRAARVHPTLRGQIGKIYEHAGMPLLGTSSGALELLSVQWEGRGVVDAAGFLNGLRGRGQGLPLEIGKNGDA